LNLLLIGIICFSCSRNSITGRNQLSLVSEEQVQQMSFKEYKTFLASNKVVTVSDPNTEMVKRVGQRIANAITQYYQQKGVANEIANYKWEFNLVDSKEVNAWCMPGGKVVVYTGILPVTQNEDALAVVLGHEITHAVAHHGNERMSQEMVAQGIGVVGGVLTLGISLVAGVFNSV